MGAPHREAFVVETSLVGDPPDGDPKHVVGRRRARLVRGRAGVRPDARTRRRGSRYEHALSTSVSKTSRQLLRRHHPVAIATVAEDGTPNVTYISVVHRIDDAHVALSRQFFKKTDENTIVNPYAQVAVVGTGDRPSVRARPRLRAHGDRRTAVRADADEARCRRGARGHDEHLQAEGHRHLPRRSRARLLPGDWPEPALDARDVKIERVEEFSRRSATSTTWTSCSRRR